jgi:predicted alpha/beta hydrolase family esterase
MDPTTRVLILPGLYSSGPEHWQSRWEAEHPGFVRVEQRDWETPDRREWVETLDRAITGVAADPSPVVLVAHSLGCCLVAHWAAAHRGPIRGALLVAPSDVEAAGFPAGPTGFAPMPIAPLPFPSLLVASTDDPYLPLSRAEHFAQCWGSRLEVLGPLGHINSASGLGSWPAGFAILRELLAPAERPVTITQACVRATLAGRKSQIRQPVAKGEEECPSGRPGDRLWVREPWSIPRELESAPPEPARREIRYAADGGPEPPDGWRPPREMPRWASRLTLEIQRVRSEPVQAISETDLLAEGGMWREGSPPGPPDAERAGFARWWSEVNARRGTTWERNPRVWVIEFRPVTML